MDGKNVVIDLDQFGGVAGLLDGVGDDEGDGVADVADGALGQHRMRRRGLRWPSRFSTSAAQGSVPRPSAFRSAAV